LVGVSSAFFRCCWRSTGEVDIFLLFVVMACAVNLERRELLAGALLGPAIALKLHCAAHSILCTARTLGRHPRGGDLRVRARGGDRAGSRMDLVHLSRRPMLCWVQTPSARASSARGGARPVEARPSRRMTTDRQRRRAHLHGAATHGHASPPDPATSPAACQVDKERVSLSWASQRRCRGSRGRGDAEPVLAAGRRQDVEGDLDRLPRGERGARVVPR
jgi:hypothetical protein